MRDVIKIFAAGSILTAYALITPTMVEAVPASAPARKAFPQRLVQAAADAPVSAVVSTADGRRTVAPGSALPRFATLGAIR